jgi:hypothetical protein
MKSNVEALPIAHEALGEMIRGQDWVGMTSAYMGHPSGLDFGPMLEGDHCQCPHWGVRHRGPHPRELPGRHRRGRGRG